MAEKEYKYMVAARCMTYNHKSYIEDALLGFAMQNTSFSVVYIIVDDASTDGEQEVLRKWAGEYLRQEDEKEIIWENLPYGEQVFASLKGKPNSFFLIILLKENHYQKGNGAKRFDYIKEWNDNAKYHALCEGDDFWVRPNKLQKQVDFLENHPDYSLCFHNAVITYDDTPKAANAFNSICEDREVTLEEIINKWVNPTASMVYRSSILPLFPVKGKFISGDWRRTLHCAVCGKVWAMKDVMSFYRKTYGSSSIASLYKGKIDEIYLQKAIILESLDEYTNFYYHARLNKYIRRNKDSAKYLLLSKTKGRMIAVLSMPGFVIRKVFARRKK